MIKTNQPSTEHFRNEQGFALVIAMMTLLLLTFIGIFALNTTTLELQIAGNERILHDRFHAADSGWKQTAPWLNNLASAPDFYNLLNPPAGAVPVNGPEGYPTDNIVRHYGGGAMVSLTQLPPFPANSQDGFISNIPYWYRAVYLSDIAAVKFGTGYRDFQYYTESYAAGTANVSTRVSRIFRVGY